MIPLLKDGVGYKKIAKTLKLRCVIIFSETHGECSSRQLSWPHYSSVSLHQIISVISKVF